MSALLSGLFDIGSNIINGIFQHNTNQDNLDYAKSMTQKQWERDDNAYQRAVKDLTSAGLSPLNAVGNPAGNSSPLNYQAQAPQLDFSNTIQAMMTQRGQDLQQHQFDKKLEQDNLQFTKQLQNNIEQFAKTFKLQQDSELDNQNRAWSLLELQEQQLIDQQNQFKTQMEYEEFKNRQEKIQNLIPEGTTRIKECQTLEEWQRSINQYKKEFDQYLQDNKDKLIESSSSGGGLNVAGLAGANLQDSTTMSEKAKKVLMMFYATHEFPVWVEDPFLNFDNNKYSPFEKGEIIKRN